MVWVVKNLTDSRSDRDGKPLLLQQPRQTNQLRPAGWNGGFHIYSAEQSHHVDRQPVRTEIYAP